MEIDINVVNANSTKDYISERSDVNFWYLSGRCLVASISVHIFFINLNKFCKTSTTNVA